MQTITKARKTHSRPQALAEVFWLLYPSDHAAALLDALHALYYLPTNFRLVAADSKTAREIIANKAYADIVKRVEVRSDLELPGRTVPSLNAGAIIQPHEAGSRPQTTAPLILIAQAAVLDIEDNEWNGFTVPAGKPEAIASAVLAISRNLLRP